MSNRADEGPYYTVLCLGCEKPLITFAPPNVVYPGVCSDRCYQIALNKGGAHLGAEQE